MKIKKGYNFVMADTKHWYITTWSKWAKVNKHLLEAPYRMDDDVWIGYTFSLCTNPKP
jgi:hypothetical protein